MSYLRNYTPTPTLPSFITALRQPDPSESMPLASDTPSPFHATPSSECQQRSLSLPHQDKGPQASKTTRSRSLPLPPAPPPSPASPSFLQPHADSTYSAALYEVLMLEVYDPTRFGGLADAFVKLAEVAAECEGVGVSLRAHLNALYVENEGGRGGWGSVGGLRIDGVVKSGIGAVTEDEEGKAEGMEAEICGARGDDGMSGGHGDGDDEMQAEVGRPAALRIVKERRDSKESESKRRGRVLEVEEESDRMVRESMGLEGWELESERKVFAQIAEKMEYDSRI